MNKTGFVKFKVPGGDDTIFSQIIRWWRRQAPSKAPIAKIADKIAGVFVPVVMVIALVTAVVWLLSGSTFEFALSCAISVLVISCPARWDWLHRLRLWWELEKGRSREF